MRPAHVFARCVAAFFVRSVAIASGSPKGQLLEPVGVNDLVDFVLPGDATSKSHSGFLSFEKEFPES